MRIIHFSDIHAGGFPTEWGALFDKRLFGGLNFLLRRAAEIRFERTERAVTRIRLLNPDLVVCTGDLTCLGEPAEFAAAREALTPLVEDGRFEFLYVPGNHDAYVRGERFARALRETFRYLNRERWELGELPRLHAHMQLRFLLLNQTQPMSLVSSGGALDEATRQYLRKRLPEEAARPRQDDDDWSRSPADEEALYRPIALVGHFPLYRADGSPPPPRRDLRGAELLREAWRNGHLRFALCGHIHHPFARQDDHGPAEYCAGSLTTTGLLNSIHYNAVEDRLHQQWLSIDEEPAPETPPLSALEGA